MASSSHADTENVSEIVDEDEIPQNPTAAKSKRQSLLDSGFYVESKVNQTKLTNSLAKLLAVSGTPFEFVELQEFKDFMALACPQYKVPCRTTFSERIIPRLYTETKDTVKLMVRDVQSISLTTDGWTGRNGSQFVAVTASYISDEWVFETVTLACRELNKSHTADHISSLIRDVLDEYKIDVSRISAITTDRGANMVAAVCNELLRPHVPCFAHVLNTFIQQILTNPFVEDILKKSRMIYNLLAYSCAAKRFLKRCQEERNLPTHKMPSACSTRWWSEIKQLQFVINHQKALADFCNDYQDGAHGDLNISVLDVKKVNIIVTFMVELERMQETLGGENSVTGSLILPLIKRANICINKISEGNITVAGVFNFRKEVAELYKNKVLPVYDRESSHLDMATYMDPRFDQMNRAAMEPIIRLDAELVNTAQEESAIQQSAPKQPRNALQVFFGDEDESEPDNGPSVENEIEDFANEKKLSLADCPLMWWKRKQGNYPKLSSVAKKYLCITATSVPSERVFSVSGNILTSKRYCLTDEHVEQLTFLTKNKKLIR